MHMSWDVLMIRTKRNSEALDEIESENIIPFKQTEIADEVRKIAAKLGAVCNCDDLSWQNLDSDKWSVEFSVGEEEAQSVMLLIRGGEPTEVFAILAADLNTRLIDCSTGKFFLPGEPTSFEQWKAYRDKIVKGQ